MKILIDGRTIRDNPAGVGYTVIELVKGLAKYSDLEITVFTRQGVKQIPLLNKIQVTETPFNYQFVGLKRFLFEQLYLPKLINRYKPDLVHLTDSFGCPFLISKKIKVVVTLHDLIPLTDYRELIGRTGYLFYRLSIQHSLYRANRIACVSQFTRRDLLTRIPTIKAEKVTTIYNGINLVTTSMPSNTSDLMNKYGLTKPFIFYLGGFPPRKNSYLLIQAFNQFNQKHNQQYQLVLAGRFSDSKDIKNNLAKINKFIRAKGLEKQIKVIGYLTKEQKTFLFRKASFFVYPSLYEGFGLPVLEAFGYETPVLTSRNTVMAEIAKDYALYAAVDNENELAEKMAEMINKLPFFKKQAIKAKKELLPLYNWSDAAQKYHQLYQKLALSSKFS